AMKDLVAPDFEIPPAQMLQSFPRGPRVPDEYIEEPIVLSYAEHNQTATSVRRIIIAAKRLRQEADSDSQVTALEIAELPDVGRAPIEDIWFEAFYKACRKGPRMVGALLFVQPDDEFSSVARTA